MKLGTKAAKALCEAQGWNWDDRWLGLECSPIKRRRSSDQNALYWVYVDALADEVGMSKNEMHNEILSELHGYDLVEFRGSVIKRPRGRSHNLPSETFSKLIMIAQEWAANMNIAVDLRREG